MKIEFHLRPHYVSPRVFLLFMYLCVCVCAIIDCRSHSQSRVSKKRPRAAGNIELQRVGSSFREQNAK